MKFGKKIEQAEFLRRWCRSHVWNTAESRVELRVNEPGCGCRCRCRPTRPMIRLVGKVCSGADEAKDVYNRRSTARWLYRIDTEAVVDFRWEGASFNPKSCTRNEVRRTQGERVKGVWVWRCSTQTNARKKVDSRRKVSTVRMKGKARC